MRIFSPWGPDGFIAFKRKFDTSTRTRVVDEDLAFLSLNRAYLACTMLRFVRYRNRFLVKLPRYAAQPREWR